LDNTLPRGWAWGSRRRGRDIGGAQRHVLFMFRYRQRMVEERVKGKGEEMGSRTEKRRRP